MLQYETLLNDIRHGLAYFQSYIVSGQPVNLTDTNVRAEVFVARLLNSLFGWTLENTNDKVANFPCIDLIDEPRRCGIQVTAEKGSMKLTKTIKCLARHDMATRVSSLKVFSLVPKQRKYSVKDCCEGIQFDWNEDVLDFNDVIREASKIQSLEHLQLVRQQVVEAFPSIFPGPDAGVPMLTLPRTDPEISWLAFSSRATKFVGRSDELRSLKQFLNSPRDFSWWLISGPAGTGKSRLALELCEQIKSEGWTVGFLGRTERGFNWQKLNPYNKTLIIIDYFSSRIDGASDAVLELCKRSTFPYPVRVLLLERNMQTWLSQFMRQESPSESAHLKDSQFGPPLVLGGLKESVLLDIAKEVTQLRGGDWDQPEMDWFLSKFRQSEFQARPIYAMILAEFPNAENLSDLLRQLLKKRVAAGRDLSLMTENDAKWKTCYSLPQF